MRVTPLNKVDSEYCIIQYDKIRKYIVLYGIIPCSPRRFQLYRTIYPSEVRFVWWGPQGENPGDLVSGAPGPFYLMVILLHWPHPCRG